MQYFTTCPPRLKPAKLIWQFLKSSLDAKKRAKILPAYFAIFLHLINKKAALKIKSTDLSTNDKIS